MLKGSAKLQTDVLNSLQNIFYYSKLPDLFAENNLIFLLFSHIGASCDYLLYTIHV